MDEPLFDLGESPPPSILYCESCTASWVMLRKDPACCPTCGARRFRELDEREMLQIAFHTMGHPSFIELLIGAEGIPPEATGLASAVAKLLLSVSQPKGD